MATSDTSVTKATGEQRRALLDIISDHYTSYVQVTSTDEPEVDGTLLTVAFINRGGDVRIFRVFPDGAVRQGWGWTD